MVRRQAIQIEAEKRALIRLLLIIVSCILGVTLVVLGRVYQLYSQSGSVVRAAETKADAAVAQSQQCDRELKDKTTQLERITNTAKQKQERNEALVQRALQGASQTELAEFARAVYDLPGRSVEVPRIPPSSLFQRIYRYKSGEQTQTFVLVGGQVDGKWMIYSNLIATNPPKQ